MQSCSSYMALSWCIFITVYIQGFFFSWIAIKSWPLDGFLQFREKWWPQTKLKVKHAFLYGSSVFKDSTSHCHLNYSAGENQQQTHVHVRFRIHFLSSVWMKSLCMLSLLPIFFSVFLNMLSTLSRSSKRSQNRDVPNLVPLFTEHSWAESLWWKYSH